MRNFNSDKAVHDFECVINDAMGRDSSVGIAARYGLYSPVSNPGGGKIFRTRPGLPWDPPSILYNRYRVFAGRKAGAWRWPSTPSSAEVKERV